MLIVPKRYSDDFKRGALEMLESGMTQRQVCEGLGVSKSALQAWQRQERMAREGIAGNVTGEDSPALRQAMRRIRQLEMENKILRQAAAYLSQAELRTPK